MRTSAPGSDIVVVNAAAPVARRAPSRRRRAAPRRRARRRRSSVGGGGGAGIQNRIQRVALGGLGYGLLVKFFPEMPRLPGVGRSGTVALACYFMKPTTQLLQDVGIAAAAIAGASFGQTGVVSGDDDEDSGVLSG